MGVWFARLLCFEICMKFTLRNCCPFCMQSLLRSNVGAMCRQGHYSSKEYDGTVDEYYFMNDSVFSVFYKVRKKKLDYRVSSVYVCRTDDVPMEVFKKPQSFEDIQAHLLRANRLAVMR